MGVDSIEEGEELVAFGLSERGRDVVVHIGEDGVQPGQASGAGVGEELPHSGARSSALGR